MLVVEKKFEIETMYYVFNSGFLLQLCHMYVLGTYVHM